ncbi:ribonuclease T2 family protein [Massilia glaciei]|nr:ribonuclease [Massilia glaciei]
MPLFRSLLLCSLLAAALPAEARKPYNEVGVFDYYAVALSWSPSFCASHDDPNQCAPGRRHGFVLHGLWPQFEKGYPGHCSSRALPLDVRNKYTSIFPSPKMIGHQWSKHGSCSGLDPAAYFTLSARLQAQVVIPQAFRQPAAPVRIGNAQFIAAFNASNPGMARNAVMPYCADGGRFLREILVCFDKGGRSRTCSYSDLKRSSNSCRKDSFVMQSVR